MSGGVKLRHLFLIVLAGVTIALIFGSVIHARQQFARDCAPHIHPVAPEKWHGGNAPKLRLPKGCS